MNTGKNPLAAVLPTSGIHTAKILLEAGADVNKVDDQLNTILHNCASYDYMELLLRADIKINKKNQLGHNALEHYIVKTGIAKEDTCMLLYAAGESTDGSTDVGLQQPPVPGSPLHEDLKHLCRECIRKHLLKLDPHTHICSTGYRSSAFLVLCAPIYFIIWE